MIIPLQYKIAAAALILVSVFTFGFFYGKNQGQQKVLKETIAQQVVETDNKTESTKLLVKNVVVYKDKIQYIEKIKPVIQREVHEIFKNSPTCVLPSEFASLHNRQADAHNHTGNPVSVP